MLPFQMENGKQKPKGFSLICLPFAHRPTGSLSFICFWAKKQRKLPVCKQTKRTKRASPSMFVCYNQYKKKTRKTRIFYQETTA